MTVTDSDLVEWIRTAGDRLPVDVSASAPWPLDPSTDQPEPPVEFIDVMEPPVDRRKLRASGLVAASVVLLTFAAVVSFLNRTDNTLAATSQNIFDDPISVPTGAPDPGTILPHIDSPPAWFGAIRPAERDAGFRRGVWTTAVIGKGDTPVESPITISATTGTLKWLESAETFQHGGITVRSVESNGHFLYGTTGSPAVVLSGAVSPEILLEVLDATSVNTGDEALGLEVRSLPDGYSVQVQPHSQANDTPTRPTLTNEDGDVAINEISEWVNAELSAANSGANYDEILVHGDPAWTGRTSFNAAGPVRFLVWSPEPGVVFEITTTNADRTIAELVELAEATSSLIRSEWLDRYN